MYISAAVKALSGFLFVSGSYLLISYLWVKDSIEIIALSALEKNAHIYALSEKITDLEKTEINVYQKNYVCKFEKKYYDCIISAVEDFDPRKKHIDIKDLKTNKKNHNINNYSLSQEGFIYRITINESVGNSINASKKIEIVQNSWNNSKKFASFKFLFALNSDDTVHEKITTPFFVISTENTIISLAAKAKLSCRASPSKKQWSLGYTRDCEVYEFSNEKINNKSLSDLSFQPFVEGSSSAITENKYYLVNLKRQVQANWAKCIEIFHNKGSKNAVDVAFEKNVMPAFYTTHKPNHIFVLGKS